MRVRAGTGVERTDEGETEACLGLCISRDLFPALEGKMTFSGRSEFPNRERCTEDTRFCLLVNGRTGTGSPAPRKSCLLAAVCEERMLLAVEVDTAGSTAVTRVYS